MSETVICSCGPALVEGKVVHASWCDIETAKRNGVAEDAAIAAGETTHEGNFIFCTSDRDALKLDLGERRFMTLNISDNKFKVDFTPGAPYVNLEPIPPAAIAWIIERAGRPPIMCHCPDVAAEMALRKEYVVTPYYSKVK